MTTSLIHDLLTPAIDTAKAHQYALTQYADALSAELDELDKLLVRFVVFCLVFLLMDIESGGARRGRCRRGPGAPSAGRRCEEACGARRVE